MDRALIMQRSGIDARDNGKGNSNSNGSKGGDKDNNGNGSGKSSNESSNKSSSTSHSSSTSSQTAKSTSAAAKAPFPAVTETNSQGDCVPMSSNPFAFGGNPFSVEVINDNNPLLNYSTGWSIASANPNGNLTNHFTRTVGSQVSFTFIGTDIRVIGIIPPSNVSDPAPVAAYTIDGGSPQTIPLPQSTQCLYGQTFFLASNLTSPTAGSTTGQHTLDIHVLDAKSSYILDYIVFTKAPNSQDDTNGNGKNGTATGTGKPASSSASDQSPQSTTRSGMSLTAIVSIILGVFALIIAIIALILLHRRRWRRLRAQRQVEENMEQGGWQEIDKTSDIMKWTSTESILRDVRSPGYAPSSFGSSQSQQAREGAAYAPYASPVKDRSVIFASNPSLSPGVSAPSKPHSRSPSRDGAGGRPMSAPPPISIHIEEV